AFYGYFNRGDQLEKFDAGRPTRASRMANALGITIADLSATGYYFTPQVVSSDREAVRKSCAVFLPDRRRRRFTFDYDPRGHGGTGRVTVTLDGRAYGLDLSPQQRRSGAVFNRFGLANARIGGNPVEFYLDDVTITARRAPGTRPKFIPQRSVEVPYTHEQA